MRENINATRTTNEIFPGRLASKYDALPGGDYIGETFVLVYVVTNAASPKYGAESFALT